MRTGYEDELLLGALLDRLGSAQGQSLLASLDRWLAEDERDCLVDCVPSDGNEFCAIESATIDANRQQADYTTPNSGRR